MRELHRPTASSTFGAIYDHAFNNSLLDWGSATSPDRSLLSTTVSSQVTGLRYRNADAQTLDSYLDDTTFNLDI